MRDYRFRLYPTTEQESKLKSAVDASGWLYNYFIAKNTRSLYDMQFALTELKEQEPWLRNYHSKMLQMVIHRIDASRKSLRARRKNGQQSGRIKAVKKGDCSSFTYNQSGFKIERHGDTDLLWLSKIGYIQIRLHRIVSSIKQITIIRRIGKWYAIICCETSKPIFQIINPTRSVGIDLGITKFIHDSNDNQVENPLFLTKMLKPLKRAHRRMSRKHKDSINQKKAKTRLQILHQRIMSKRNDFLHKTSANYASKYDIIFLENLKVANMIRGRHIGRSIIDSGWNTFNGMLSYKAKLVIRVSPNNTSINCSKCGQRVPKSLAVRTHRCDRCNLVIDRDFNASLNIKQKGLLILPQGLREVTPVEIGVPCNNVVVCSQSMKQEQTIGHPITAHG